MKFQILGLSVLSLALLAPFSARAEEHTKTAPYVLNVTIDNKTKTQITVNESDTFKVMLSSGKTEWVIAGVTTPTESGEKIALNISRKEPDAMGKIIEVTTKPTMIIKANGEAGTLSTMPSSANRDLMAVTVTAKRDIAK